MTGLDLTAEALSLDAAVTVPETLYYDVRRKATVPLNVPDRVFRS
jgi:hypothetical protein